MERTATPHETTVKTASKGTRMMTMLVLSFAEMDLLFLGLTVSSFLYHRVPPISGLYGPAYAFSTRGTIKLAVRAFRT